MKTIKVGFSKSKKKFPILSYLIRWYQKTEYSHIFIEIEHKHLFGVNTIYHSNGDSGVSYYAKPVFLEKNQITDLYEFRMIDDIYREFRKNCHKQLGRSYATMQNLGILMVDLANLLGLPIRNPWRHGFNCSEAVLRALQSSFSGLSDIDPNTVKPVDIQRILDSKGLKKLV